MSRSRLEAFSDGVFAVAITLLALNLAVTGPGHGSLAHQLANRWPAFAAYAVSFATIGIIWVNHHGVFRSFAAIDRVLVFLNLLLLFFVVLIPFATTTLADFLRGGGSDAHLAAAIYALVLELMSVAFFLVFWYPIRHGLLEHPLPPESERTAVVRFCFGLLGYAVAIGLAFVSATVTLVLSGLLAVYYLVDQTPEASRTTAVPDGAASDRASP
ncbi:MAG TPA: TMEM175 family protein [Acidimicrobiia bacterium]|nr:TMEM175 family protein [Acidimicrobiia bacterium]